MEFTKNYSDDLLMGQNEGTQSTEAPAQTTDDLADFELAGVSGSNNENEVKQKSPVKRKSSSSVAQSSSCGTSPNLKAVKNLLLANYSKISHVLHWDNPIETGIIFGVGAAIILALTFFSIISVFAYTGLGLILGSASLRTYKAVAKILNIPPETKFDHLWSKAQGIEVSISSEKMHDLVDSSLGTLNSTLSYVKRVLLVEDKFATVTFGSILYVLTYIGSWFNGMTLITLLYLGLFSVPLVYQKNRAKIDEIANVAHVHMTSAMSLVTNKVSSLTSGASKKKD